MDRTKGMICPFTVTSGQAHEGGSAHMCSPFAIHHLSVSCYSLGLFLGWALEGLILP